jgi:5,5'-dehydrodivanillate O-demethylase
MLSVEDNQLLTRVGPGTPMGELLRRYWQPIAAVTELDDTPVKQVRLLGEDLALYRDGRGTYGLVDLHCPHRGANLSYGLVEECGLRCNYHGWMFNENGECIEQPFEDVVNPEGAFKRRVRTKAYRVEPKAGILWAYLGPDPVPCLWDWDRYHDAGRKRIGLTHVPCNWLQCQENSIDPVHFEWLHTNWSLHLGGKRTVYSPTHVRIAFDEFEFGFVYRRVLANTDERHPYWTTGRVCLWPNALYAGSFVWHVPVDDENTLDVTWTVDEGRRPARAARQPFSHRYREILDAKTGRLDVTPPNQDTIAMVGQGTIVDRTREHLGESDRGVTLMRQRFLSDLKILAEGGDPKGIVRDPARNQRIHLPRIALTDVPGPRVSRWPGWRSRLRR